MTKIIILFSLILLTASGCMSYPGGVATSTIPVTARDSYTIVRRNATGTDTFVSIIGIPISPFPSTWNALQDAKKQYNADALINVTVETEYNFICILLWFQEIKVTGDAITFRIGGGEIE